MTREEILDAVRAYYAENKEDKPFRPGDRINFRFGVLAHGRQVHQGI